MGEWILDFKWMQMLLVPIVDVNKLTSSPYQLHVSDICVVFTTCLLCYQVAKN